MEQTTEGNHLAVWYIGIKVADNPLDTVNIKIKRENLYRIQ